MNNVNKKILFPRRKRFLFKEYSVGLCRFNITQQDDTKILGSKIGLQVLSVFHNNIPIKGIYVFGRIGMGKTVLSTSIIKSFENTEDLLIDIKHKVIYRYYDTYPKCYHLDYYSFLRKDFPWKEKIELKSDELIIAEWSDYLPKQPVNYFENDRIEIELFYCFDKKDIITQTKVDAINFNEITADNSMRFASLIGYGAGIQLIENLKNDSELKQLIVDPTELE